MYYLPLCPCCEKNRDDKRGETRTMRTIQLALMVTQQPKFSHEGNDPTKQKPPHYEKWRWWKDIGVSCSRLGEWNVMCVVFVTT